VRSSWKTATIPPFREEFDEYLNHVDVYKMHGRDSFDRLNETMEIVDSYSQGMEVLIKRLQKYI
jgi:hypothetical protein